MLSFLNKSAPAAGRAFNERRVVERRRVLKDGLIRFDEGFRKSETTIRNLSAGGARLTAADVSALPRRFELKLGAGGDWYSVSVKWRTATEIGVGFD